LLNWLFNWKIRPKLISYALWKAYSNPVSMIRNPGFWRIRQFWVWEHPSNPNACWSRWIVAKYVTKNEDNG
jgi:hypothetical protein